MIDLPPTVSGAEEGFLGFVIVESYFSLKKKKIFDTKRRDSKVEFGIPDTKNSFADTKNSFADTKISIPNSWIPNAEMPASPGFC